MEPRYELYQNGKLMFVGDKKYLAEMTELAESTIGNYCTPGFFDNKKNETKIKIVRVQ